MPSAFVPTPAARRIASRTCCGVLPPRVSQSTSTSAPASAAAFRHASVYAAVGAEAVEEMLGVEDHLVDALLEVGDGVADHVEVCFAADAQIVANVQVPGLADDGHDRRLGLEQLSQVQVIGCGRIRRGASSRTRRLAHASASSLRTLAKNSSSRGLEPGQPPSM